MALPLLIAGAAVAVGSAVYKAYKDGKISKEEYERQTRLAEEYQRALENIGPGEVMPPVSLEMYEVMGQYTPEIASFYSERAPELITESESQGEIAKQREALSQLSQMAKTGDDAISRAERVKTGFEADQAAQSRRAEIARQQAMRGVGGQGSDTLAQIAGQQDIDQTQYLAGQQAAADAQARRMQALQGMSNLAGTIRGQNFNVEQANRDVMNAFYQRMASAKNNYNQYVANQRNQAQKYNLENLQNISSANVDQRNKQAVMDRGVAQQEIDNLRDYRLGMAETKFGQGSKLAELLMSGKRQDVANQAAIGATAGGAMTSLGGAMAARGAQPTVPPQQNLTESNPGSTDLIEIQRRKSQNIA